MGSEMGADTGPDNAVDEAPESGGSARQASLGAALRGSLGQLGATLLAIGHNRAALLAIELEAEKRRVLAVMAWGAFGLFMGTMTLLWLAAFATALFWDEHRLLVMGLITVIFASLGAFAALQVRGLMHSSGGALQATMAELEADRAALAGQGHSMQERT